MYKVGRCRLRELRLRRGWTQDELSIRSGLSKSSISSLESGTHEMRVGSAKNLSYALGCDIDDLYEWKRG